MSDFLRQLRNDEKRCTFSMVGTIDKDLASEASVQLPLFVVPKRSTIARIYAVTKEPFATGAEVTIEIYRGSEDGDVLFTTLPLDTTNTVTLSDVGDTAGRYSTEEYVGATFNQEAVDSVVGEAQIVVEFTEVPVTAGKYSK